MPGVIPFAVSCAGCIVVLAREGGHIIRVFAYLAGHHHFKVGWWARKDLLDPQSAAVVVRAVVVDVTVLKMDESARLPGEISHSTA